MYIVSTSVVVPDAGEFTDLYDDIVRAQQDAVKYAQGDSRGATYYVYEVTTKAVFKAQVQKTVNTEVLS
jgi:hypothetical protein